MKNIKKQLALVILFVLSIVNLQAQNTNADNPAKKTADAPDIAKLRAAVEINPNDFDTHLAYIRAMKFDSPEVIKQYDEWIAKYPKSVMFPYAIGELLTRRANPKGRTYLFKALEIDPAYHKAYCSLWSEAQLRGEFDKGREYILKAKELDPKNADYAFYYAGTFDDTDPEKYKKLSLEVAKDFPNTERGSQALYWLAHHTKDTKEKIGYFEQQEREFPAGKFDWTSAGMSSYYNLVLLNDPIKAKAISQSMIKLKGEEDKTWPANLKLALGIVEAKDLLSGGKASEALAIFDKLTLPRYAPFMNDFVLFKAKVQDAANNSAAAYQTVLAHTAKEPAEELNEAMINYGKKLGKDQKKMNEDILYIRDTASKQAPNFTLENYFTKSTSSLSDYKGKVVLLTFWYPGCGPCRAEFPYFENVVRKFKGKEFVYLGINLYEKEDDYVIPFVKSSGYSFIPLKDNKNWTKGPLENKGLAPVNFLIDQNGKVIFSWFRTNKHNEATLEMMINSLLTGQAI